MFALIAFVIGCISVLATEILGKIMDASTRTLVAVRKRCGVQNEL